MISADTRCYRHPDRAAAVGCQRCGRPICPECMRPASVGFHCPEDARQGAQQVMSGRQLMNRRPPATTALLVAIIGIFVVQMLTSSGSFSRGVVTNEGLLFGPSVQDGEWWRIVTSAFLHNGPLHLAFNGYALWILGSLIERLVGTRRLVLCYVAGLFGGSAAVLAFNFGVPTLGASGAVLGLAGALAGAVRGDWRVLRQSGIGFIIVANLALPLLIGGISFWGHLGGILGGFAAGWFVGRPATRDGAAAGRNEAIAAAVSVALAVASVVAATAGGFVAL